MRSNVQRLRQEIDYIDDQIKVLFIKRMELVSDISAIKAILNLPIMDITREHDIQSRLTSDQNEEMAKYTKNLFAVIFETSRSYQARKLGLHHEE